jgi:hypothetical protein
MDGSIEFNLNKGQTVLINKNHVLHGLSSCYSKYIAMIPKPLA